MRHQLLASHAERKVCAQLHPLWVSTEILTSCHEYTPLTSSAFKTDILLSWRNTAAHRAQLLLGSSSHEQTIINCSKLPPWTSRGWILLYSPSGTLKPTSCWLKWMVPIDPTNYFPCSYDLQKSFHQCRMKQQRQRWDGEIFQLSIIVV